MGQATWLSDLSKARAVLEVFVPAAIAIAYVYICILQLLTRRKQKGQVGGMGKGHRKSLNRMSPLICFTFIVQAVLLLSEHRLHSSSAFPREATMYYLSSILLWATLSIALIESQSPTWLAYTTSWVVAAIADTGILVLKIRSQKPQNPWDVAHISIQLVRIMLLGSAVCYSIWSTRSTRPESAHSDDERQSLLGDAHPSTQPNDYQSIGEDSSQDGDEPTGDEDREYMKAMQKKRLEEHGGWLGYIKGFAIFLPYVVPYRDTAGKLWLLVTFICVIAERFLTLMTPMLLGRLIAALQDATSTGILPWKQLVLWGFVRFFINEIVSTTRNIASQRLSQQSYRKLNAVAFSHVMALSMDYHTSKSSGRVAKAIEQGSRLESVFRDVVTMVPMALDLVIALVYLSSYFDYYLGLIIVATCLSFSYSSAKGNGVTAPLNRMEVQKSRKESEVLYDSITNWQTVVYHNRTKFEEKRYDEAVVGSIMAERRSMDIHALIHTGQDFVMEIVLFAACAVVAWRIASGLSTVSDFVFLTSYWSSIQSPMYMFSYTFRSTISQLIAAEWLFQTLQTKPSVRDRPDAKDLVLHAGRVEFKGVSFAYDPARPILTDMSFTAEPGQSIAFVGETGGGKSTTLKLLYRFYDVTAGSISIDGQDLRDVTLYSLRENLGAVPQDPSVFDQTIMENLLYARPGASTDEVHAACKAARIHHQILIFPRGYETRVGERGVQLSGGELQRLAIARVILRSPKVVILDEATSAVDSDTEHVVQQAIGALSAGRTVFTVAHRLSTIVNSDVILVIDKGQVVEKGTHSELLRINGKYAKLWAIQTAAYKED